MKLIWKLGLFLLPLSGCINTKPIQDDGLIKLSENGDYIRPIKTSKGYYYNNPKDGKLIYMRKN